MSIQLNFKILFFNSKIHTVLIYKTLVRTHNYDVQSRKLFPLRFCIEQNYT